METLEEKIERVLKDRIELVPYDPAWPALFEDEKRHLLSCFPGDMIRRIEHFGSTSVPGLCAKPVVDVLAEVASLEVAKKDIAPVLEAKGYDYFWRSSGDDSKPPFYAWFIKRNSEGRRTHHIHMVESQFDHWDRLLFRDYLIENWSIADEYANLKLNLCLKYPDDRVAYTRGKTEFVVRVTGLAKEYYGK